MTFCYIGKNQQFFYNSESVQTGKAETYKPLRDIKLAELFSCSPNGYLVFGF